jgi:hypothetical protein
MRGLRHRIAWTGLGTVLAFGFLCASPAVAEERVPLQGKHTKAQVDTACDGVNGIKVQGQSGGSSGYGCYNPKNGILVACDNSGDCIGFIPKAGGKPAPNLTVLGVDKAQLEADPFVPPKKPPVRAPASRGTTPAAPR